MNAWLRTLEAWTTHQDYVWFLAVLAWAGVIAAELWRKENTAARPPRGWLVALASGCAASGPLAYFGGFIALAAAAGEPKGAIIAIAKG